MIGALRGYVAVIGGLGGVEQGKQLAAAMDADILEVAVTVDIQYSQVWIDSQDQGGDVCSGTENLCQRGIFAEVQCSLNSAAGAGQPPAAPGDMFWGGCPDSLGKL